MNSLLPPVLVLAATAAVSLVLTRLLLALLRARAVLDIPNERSSHSVPTPKGGGLAVVAVIAGAWLVLPHLLVWPWEPFAGLAALLVVLTLLGFCDDLAHVPAWARLTAHLLCAAIVVHFLLPDAPVGPLPSWLAQALLTLALVWFMNLTNFMDGIDGITGTEALSLVAGLAVVALANGAMEAGGLAMLAPIAGAVLGFLAYNWHPARLFLGDAGSVPLGLALGTMLLVPLLMGNWAVPLILPMVYWLDSGLTLLRRLFRGEKPWRAHRQHFYQRAVAAGLPHDGACLIILAANAGLIACGVWSLVNPWGALFVAVLIGAGVLAIFTAIADRRRTP